MTATENQPEPHILFELAGTTYAIASRTVQQMEMVEQITPVPNAPAYVAGVVFLRGQVVSAINLRKRFGFETIKHDFRTRLVVVGYKGRTVGLIVDSAREFAAIPWESMQPPPEAITGLSGKYLRSIATLGDRLVLVLNVDEILNFSDIPSGAPEGA